MRVGIIFLRLNKILFFRFSTQCWLAFLKVNLMDGKLINGFVVSHDACLIYITT